MDAATEEGGATDTRVTTEVGGADKLTTATEVAAEVATEDTTAVVVTMGVAVETAGVAVVGIDKDVRDLVASDKIGIVVVVVVVLLLGCSVKVSLNSFSDSSVSSLLGLSCPSNGFVEISPCVLHSLAVVEEFNEKRRLLGLVLEFVIAGWTPVGVLKKLISDFDDKLLGGGTVLFVSLKLHSDFENRLLPKEAVSVLVVKLNGREVRPVLVKKGGMFKLGF